MAMAEVVSVCVCVCVCVGFFALDGSGRRRMAVTVEGCVCVHDARWPSVRWRGVVFERGCGSFVLDVVWMKVRCKLADGSTCWRWCGCKCVCVMQVLVFLELVASVCDASVDVDASFGILELVASV